MDTESVKGFGNLFKIKDADKALSGLDIPANVYSVIQRYLGNWYGWVNTYKDPKR